MIYRNLLGERVSMLGFGAMRLPVGEDGEINLPLATKMIERAIASGVNYFDTAYPYHGGKSEIVLGEILSRYPRGSFFLANKFPGHQLMKRYDPAAIFEEQLKKCGVEYFDFYLLHNVYERSMGVYTDPELGILDYFLEQKKNGRIRHLGFSTHALTDGLLEFLDLAGEHMEFCQIQMNYLDYTLQDAKGKYELLTERGIPVIVMEPVRGGKLASLDEKYVRLLEREAPGASAASFAFRYLMDFDNISVVLSGMSNMAYGLVRVLHVQGILVGFGVNRHGADTHFPAGADGSHGDLAAVCDQYFLAHIKSSFSVCSIRVLPGLLTLPS